jgi:hypothetical protein
LSRPAATLKSVVLPQAEAPSTTAISPPRTLRSRARSAGWRSNVLSLVATFAVNSSCDGDAPRQSDAGPHRNGAQGVGGVAKLGSREEGEGWERP